MKKNDLQNEISSILVSHDVRGNKLTGQPKLNILKETTERMTDFVKKYINEVIGEDEKWIEGMPVAKIRMEERNGLRQAQREAAFGQPKWGFCEHGVETVEEICEKCL